MNGDRRLLEQAAKAAGLMFDPTVRHRDGLLVVRPGARCQSDQMLWNPLTDDGDALRLAVDLRLTVLESSVRKSDGDVVNVFPGEAPDRYAATRLAVVRAAASIGEALP